MKNIIIWLLLCLHEFIFIIGRTRSILAPVVPIILERNVPINNVIVLTLGEPTKSPSREILPATQNNPNNKTLRMWSQYMKLRYMKRLVMS